MSNPKREKLEVPSVTSIEQRLNVTDASIPKTKPVIAPVQRSALLDRVRQFVPELDAANQTLAAQIQAQPAHAFDIEHVDEGQEGGYIEMDLACGLFDLHDGAAVAAAERAVQQGGGLDLGQDLAALAAGSSSSDDDDDEDDDDSSDGSGSGDDAMPDAGAPQGQGGAAAGGAEEGGAGGMEVEEEGGAGSRERVKAKRGTPKIIELN